MACSPPHGWHSLALSESTVWAGEAFLVEEQHISVCVGTIGDICTAHPLTSGDHSELNTHVLGI